MDEQPQSTPAPQDAQVHRIKCPRCGGQYVAKTDTAGRRVRCHHCKHVWRHEPALLGQVSDALAAEAERWTRLGSTILAATSHASTVGDWVAETPPPHLASSEWVDKSLGKYAIKAVLGQGAMGFVYEAVDRELKRTVALKILPHRVEPGQEPPSLRLFLQEARSAAQLSHPNAVTIYDVGSENGIYYFAMERIHGMTLAALVQQRGPLPAAHACYVVSAAARALAAAHQLGIVHRDVKPSNIMLDHAGHVRVADFGLALLADGGDLPELTARPMGTPGWVAPEIARGDAATPAGDIYALGLTLYFALTGKRLFDGPSRSGVMKLHRHATSIDRNDLPADWPPRLRDVLAQCLEADPEARYRSAAMLAADLTRVMAPDAADATMLLGGANGPPPSRLAPRWLSWAALVALAVVAVLLAYVIRRTVN